MYMWRTLVLFVYWFVLQNLRHHICCRAIKTTIIGVTVINYQCPYTLYKQLLIWNYKCSEGKTFRLIKRHHCLLCHFLFKACLSHTGTCLSHIQELLALQLQYLWDICSIHCYLLWAYFIWDLCYIPCGKFPIKHISLVVVIILDLKLHARFARPIRELNPDRVGTKVLTLPISLLPLHKLQMYHRRLKVNYLYSLLPLNLKWRGHYT